jgi:hypothetical protein
VRRCSIFRENLDLLYRQCASIGLG